MCLCLKLYAEKLDHSCNRFVKELVSTRFGWIWPKIWERVEGGGIFTHADSSCSVELNADADQRQKRAGGKKSSGNKWSADSSGGPWISNLH